MRFGQVLRKNKIFVIPFLVVMVAIAIFFYFFKGDSFIPNDFKNARSSASQTASEIVSLMESSFENLDQIEKNDRSYNFSKALDLVQQEKGRVYDIIKRATKLNEELSNMAKAVPNIKPENARNLAYEMVSDGVALIGHLLIYNQYLGGLLETLKFKFSGDIRYDSGDVQAVIKNMNQEAQEVNKLNTSFNEKLSDLDNLVK